MVVGTCDPSYSLLRRLRQGELLEPKRWRLQWAKIMALHSGLGNRARFCLKKKREEKRRKEKRKKRLYSKVTNVELEPNTTKTDSTLSFLILSLKEWFRLVLGVLIHESYWKSWRLMRHSLFRKKGDGNLILIIKTRAFLCLKGFHFCFYWHKKDSLMF